MHDLISRQDAIDAILGITPIQNTIPLVSAIFNIKKLPSARKMGEWIQDRLISTNGGTYGVRRCSNCESYYHDVGYGWNFCPNCGADMRGDNNDA